MTAPVGTVWCDVEDLFDYVRHSRRLGGIQRVSAEMWAALWRAYGASGRVQFVRRGLGEDLYRAVPWAEIAAVLDALTGPDEVVEVLEVEMAPTAAVAGLLPASVPRPRTRSVARRAAGHAIRAALPRGVHARLYRIAAAQLAALREAARFARYLLRGPAPAPAAVPPSEIVATATLRRGDVLLILGSPWFRQDDPAVLRRLRDRDGVRVAVFVHDLIPMLRPEWCAEAVRRDFCAWFDGVLPLADVIMANSQAVRADLARALEMRSLPTRAIPVLPKGTEHLSLSATAGAGPIEGPFVLYVATLEARKNHMLLLRVWRRLSDALPPERVPTLVLAGRMGWLVQDLMRQLVNCRFLDGKIRLETELSDAALAACYRDCLFTVFPSLTEGWGMPVTESLAHGAPCIASRVGAIQEAGGDLCRYFDPDNTTEAYHVIRAALDDTAGLRAWRERIRREFVSVTWAESAATILAAVGHASPASAQAEERASATS